MLIRARVGEDDVGAVGGDATAWLVLEVEVWRWIPRYPSSPAFWGHG
jgi:hypothetical protein